MSPNDNNNPKNLERQADELLSDFLRNKKKNKMDLMEYPFLSQSQQDRIHRREIPFSNLSLKQRLRANTKGVDITDKPDSKRNF